MKMTLDGFKMIFKFGSKYWVGMSFILIFIVVSMSLTVLSTKYLGESIDSGFHYVSNQIAFNKQEEFLDEKGCLDILCKQKARYKIKSTRFISKWPF